MKRSLGLFPSLGSSREAMTRLDKHEDEEHEPAGRRVGDDREDLNLRARQHRARPRHLKHELGL